MNKRHASDKYSQTHQSSSPYRIPDAWQSEQKRKASDDILGEVTLAGWGTTDEKTQIMELVTHIGTRAAERSPEHHILKIEDLETRLHITTNDAHLAVTIGKEVDAARKGGTLIIDFPPDNAPARVTWTAKTS